MKCFLKDISCTVLAHLDPHVRSVGTVAVPTLMVAFNEDPNEPEQFQHFKYAIQHI